MAASKNSSNSSKTAHVMNLLRKNEPTPQPSEDSVGASAPVTPAPAPQVPPIVTSLNADAEISSQIRDALETALEDTVETGTSTPEAPVHATEPPAFQAPPSAPAAPLPPETSAEPETPIVPAAPEPPISVEEPAAEDPVDASLFEPLVVTEAVSEPTAAELPAAADDKAVGAVDDAPAPVAVPEASPSPPNTVRAQDPDTPTLHNVMQQLVEPRAQKYMELFGLCQCHRCKSDVLALTLNNLLPRYIVISSSGLSPLLDMYGNRYNGEITAQLLHACKQVMEHPRHNI